MATKQFRKFGQDAELLDFQFRIADPLNSIDRLSRDKPSRASLPEIIAYYDETPFGGRVANPDEPFLWCCHCQKDTHWKGYVVEDETTNRYTIGNRCGLEHYGAQFEQVERSFNERRARQGILRAFIRLSAKIENLEDSLQTILDCPELKSLESATKEMFSFAPRAFKTLLRSVERGSLVAVKRSRDFEAESVRSDRYEKAIARYQSLPSEERRALRDSGLKPEFEDEPIFVSETIDFGFVTGTSALGLDDPRKEALLSRSALKEFRRVQNKGTDQFSPKELSTVRRNLSESIDRLRNHLTGASFAEEFFSADNLNRLENWSGCFRGFSFRKDGKSLVAQDEGSSAITITPISSRLIVHPSILDAVYYNEVEEELLAKGNARFSDPDDPLSPVIV